MNKVNFNIDFKDKTIVKIQRKLPFSMESSNL